MTCSLLSVLALIAVISVALAELADFTPCTNDPGTCTVSNVRITPCTKVGQLCFIKKGRASSYAFDFTPTFTSSNLVTDVYWTGPNYTGLEIELTLGGFFMDRCEYAACPTTVTAVANQQQVFNYSLGFRSVLPSDAYHIRWKLWDKDNSNNMCCFETTIKVS